MPTAAPFPKETLMHVVKTMPSGPQVLSRLRHISLDPNVDLDDVTALLRCDVALTARIIRVANSPVYCSGAAYSSIEQALARVGFGEIYRIAGFAALVQMTSQNLRLYGITGAELRENSLMSALLMEILAEPAGVDANEAYSAGLLRSTGKLALEGLIYSAGLMRMDGKSAIGGQSGKASQATYNPKADGALGSWESATAGLSNCEAAAFILHEWRFPVSIVSAIGYHYAPEQASTDPKLASLLNLSAGVAERLGFGLPGESSYWPLEPGKLAAAGVDEGDLNAASDKALERFCSLHSAVS